MGSMETLVRPDLVPGWTQFEPTTVQLRTVTGELASMKGRGVLTLTVGGRTVSYPVWLAAVQDPCILSLDFLRATGCQLDLEKGTLCFQGGPAVTMAPPNVSVSQLTRLLTQTVAAAETSFLSFPHLYDTPLYEHGPHTPSPAAPGRGGDDTVGRCAPVAFCLRVRRPQTKPIVMVPKKGGQWRFCVDYRQLNEVTMKDSYPLPCIDEALDLVTGSSWFSSLDLRSGYFRVPFSMAARPKTAF
ncbi:hypothetical protein AAFF_G00246450 [Aldrovandia affinis]|uniref:ribonuclease H n=1 Tax=Aldrovandia affinis TaxID=143900 RepID=A0AAD7SU19_9TELE|nr:hypothetical protein AAFF_G00246450 [Aldrovandia affinis]